MIIPPSLKLETDKVILRPMQHEDISSFARITNDASVWRYFTFLLNNSAELQRWIETALKEREEGKRIPFTIIEKATGDVCGSTSLGSYFLLR
jgi:RimJ/RimL family protein N-acetyltransferase